MRRHPRQADFVYSVSRDFARSCQTPMLVIPDHTPAHPYHISVDIASLCPNAEVTVCRWKNPPELKARTINPMRTPSEGSSTSDGNPLISGFNNPRGRQGDGGTCKWRAPRTPRIWRSAPLAAEGKSLSKNG
jgi:hypothetical protein